jgi:hypothetical protein
MAPVTPNDWKSMNTDARIEFHKQSISAQLRQLRQLFVLAVAMNRTLVLPRLLCFCDRYWGPVEQCKVPGAFATELPFTCPMDHIMEPFHFDDRTDTHGPIVR